MIYNSESEVKETLQKIAQEIGKEMEEENPDKDLITKLMFKQLMQGLYLQIFN